MIFALLFILAFLIGLASYLISNKWLTAVLISMGLFIISTLTDTDARDNWSFTLIFGLPIVFVASLLGAYVVELRRGEDDQNNTDQSDADQSEEGEERERSDT